MPGSAPVSCRDLWKDYRRFLGLHRYPALRGISFSMEKGEILGLLGPNGSGKTTTMKILAGLCRPTRGHALLLGCNPAETAVRSRLGFLPEDDTLYGFLNGEETLDFFGRLFRIPGKERKKRIEKLLSLVGLAKERTKPVRSYSKGMLRRLSLAQALINEPEVLLLDEPTSGLDPLGILTVRDLLLSLQEEGTSLLLASHLLSEVEKICTRIAILHQGELLAEGRVRELLEGEGAVKLQAKGMGKEGAERLREFIKEQGGEVESLEEGARTLESFFIDTVREKKEKETGP